MHKSAHSPLHLDGFTMILIIVLVTLLGDSVEAISKQEEDILSNYRAVGMGESVNLVKSGKPSSADDSFLVDPLAVKPPSVSTKRPELPEDEPAELDPSLGIIPGAPSPKDPNGDIFQPGNADDEHVHAFEEDGHKDSRQLWVVPPNENRHLTRLITANEPNTFIKTEVSKPEKPEGFQKGNKKYLAQYRVLVPIWIPAIKQNKNKIVQIKPDPVKYVKETHTEMVPVTKNVAVKKTVVKPERVPQKIVTDFVKAPKGGVSSRMDDQVKPGEEIIGSVVTNFQ